jgi:hypothetical protein
MRGAARGNEWIMDVAGTLLWRWRGKTNAFVHGGTRVPTVGTGQRACPICRSDFYSMMACKRPGALRDQAMKGTHGAASSASAAVVHQLY